MSLTLGEKLRQAREERGLSLSEVADQTRIAGHYLEAIEADDYRTLPGGIFNKGFVKSFAKLVDIDEQEALRDYASLISAAEAAGEEPLKVYKPEVLTDDRHGGSMIPTVIVAVIILGVMTAGVLYLVDYLRNQPATPPPVAANTANTANNTNTAPTPAGNLPDFASAKFEFTALNQPVRVVVTSDGAKTDQAMVAGTPLNFEPKESINFNYNRWNAAAVQLKINGKTIALPTAPLSPADAGRIQFTINKDNFAKVWETGSITGEVPAATGDANTNTNANIETTAPATVPAAPKPVVPKPVSNMNTAATPGERPADKPAATPKPVPPANKPAPTTKPAANKP